MSRERHSKVIDGDLYEMTQFGATQGYRLFHRILRILGPSFGHIMDALVVTKDIRDVDLSSDVVVEGIKALTESFKEADMDLVVDLMKKATHVGVGGSRETVPLSGVFEAHFSGRIGSMFKWLGWGLQVQYGSFTSAFAGLMPPGEGGGSAAANGPTP